MRKKYDYSETKHCEGCSREYGPKPLRYEAWKMSRFCSRKCQGRVLGIERLQPRPKNPCLHCGNIIILPEHRRVSEQYHQRRYCSRACAIEGIRKNLRKSFNDYKVGFEEIDGKKIQFRVHRKVAEKALGRPLKRHEVVHHINGNKADNRNCNLLICTNSYHRQLHDRMAQMWMKEHIHS
jgi:hypothetical protein